MHVGRYFFFFSDEHPLSMSVSLGDTKSMSRAQIYDSRRAAELLISVPFARFIIYNGNLLKHQLNCLIHEDQKSARSKNYQFSTLSSVAVLCWKTWRMLSIDNTAEDKTRGCAHGKMPAIPLPPCVLLTEICSYFTCLVA